MRGFHAACLVNRGNSVYLTNTYRMGGGLRGNKKGEDSPETEFSYSVDP